MVIFQNGSSIRHQVNALNLSMEAVKEMETILSQKRNARRNAWYMCKKVSLISNFGNPKTWRNSRSFVFSWKLFLNFFFVVILFYISKEFLVKITVRVVGTILMMESPSGLWVIHHWDLLWTQKVKMLKHWRWQKRYIWAVLKLGRWLKLDWGSNLTWAMSELASSVVSSFCRIVECTDI